MQIEENKKDIIKSIERKKLIEFMQNNYHPKKMIFSAAGKVNHDKFVDMIINSTKNYLLSIKHSYLY